MRVHWSWALLDGIPRNKQDTHIIHRLHIYSGMGDRWPLAPFGHLRIHTDECIRIHVHMYVYIYVYNLMYIHVYLCII